MTRVDSSYGWGRVTRTATLACPILLALLVLRCVQDFVGTPRQPGGSSPSASVQVFPGSATLTAVGATTKFRVIFRDIDGTEIPGQSIAWTSLNPAIATVDSATGLVTARASGQVTIQAIVKGTPGYALITVAPAGARPIGGMVALPVAPGEPLQALWGAHPGDVLAASATGSIYHFDGSAWSSAGGAPNHEALYALWGTSGNDVFAVGERGVILHNGIPQPGIGVQRLNGVWGSAPNDVFAVGAGGTIAHYDGIHWDTMTSHIVVNLRGVWGTGGSNVYAVGDGGVILRFDGKDWSQQSSGVSAILFGVWGTSPNDVYAVGSNGTLLHFDGAQWSSTSLETDATFFAVWGTSTSDAYVAGPAGVLLRFDGRGWVGIPVDSVTAHAVWGTLNGDLLVARDDGTLLQGKRGGAARLVFTRMSTTVVAGVALDTVEVMVIDARGQPVVDAIDSVSIALRSGPAGSLLLGTTTVRADSGRARFVDLRLDVAATNYTLEVSTPRLPPATSPPFVVSAGTPRRLRFLNDPGTAVAGEAFAPAVQVAVEDSLGNRVLNATTAVGIGVLPPVTVLNGTPNHAQLNGVATFPDLNITRAANGYRLVSGASGLAGDTTSTFAVGPALADQVTVAPDGAWLAVPGDTQPFTVSLVIDRYQNPIVGRAVAWTSLNPAIATVDPVSGVATAVASGQASIGALIDAANGYALVTVSVGGRSPVTVWDSLPSGTSHHLRAVSGTSSSDVWAVGDGGTILHFDGNAWTRAASGIGEPLYGVWAASPTEAFAVGGVGSAPLDTGVIMTYRAGSWRWMLSHSGIAHPAHTLSAIWGSSPIDVFAVGRPGSGDIQEQSNILNYGGFQWIGVGPIGGGGGWLHGVWGASTTVIHAVGDAALQRIVGGWLLHPEEGGGDFGVWGVSPSDIFAVADGGIAHFDGATWSPQLLDAALHLRAVSGTSPTDVYAVGQDGVMLRTDGATWTTQPSPTTRNLNGIWIAPSGEVFVVGDGGLILRGRR